MLPAGDKKQILLPLLRGDAKGCHHIQRNVDIGAALHRRQDAERTVTRQQRQRQQQSGDELAAHVSAQGIVSRRQLPRKRDGLRCFGHHYPSGEQQILVDAHPPLHQPPCTGERGASALQQRRRDAEAQGAAALPAGIHRVGTNSASYAGDMGRIPDKAARAAHGPDAVHSGQHILASGDAADAALPLCQRTAQEHPVAAALGRRRGRRSPGPARENRNGHRRFAPFSRMSTASRYPAKPLPATVATQAGRT